MQSWTVAVHSPSQASLVAQRTPIGCIVHRVVHSSGAAFVRRSQRRNRPTLLRSAESCNQKYTQSLSSVFRDSTSRFFGDDRGVFFFFVPSRDSEDFLQPAVRPALQRLPTLQPAVQLDLQSAFKIVVRYLVGISAERDATSRDIFCRTIIIRSHVK